MATSVFYFLVFLFLHFLVVGSVRYIKLTHVGFRAHVKIASQIVSYRIVSYRLAHGTSTVSTVGLSADFRSL